MRKAGMDTLDVTEADNVAPHWFRCYKDWGRASQRLRMWWTGLLMIVENMTPASGATFLGTSSFIFHQRIWL